MRLKNITEFIVLAARWIISLIVIYWIGKKYDLQDIFFSYISVAAIIQLDMSASFTKSINRALGTLIGGVLTYTLLSFAAHSTYLVIISSVAVSFLAAYIIFQAPALRYTGIMIGITLVNILSLYDVTPSAAETTMYRCLFVFIGISALMITDIMFSILFDKKMVNAEDFKKMGVSSLKQLVTPHASRIFAASQMCLATSIALIPWLIFKYPDGYWVAVSCFFVMEDSCSVSKIKAKFRFLAHIGSSLMGWLIVFAGSYYPETRLPLVFLGVCIISGIMIKNREKTAIGNTMGIALMIMALGGGYETIVHRLGYTTIGIILGLFVSTVCSKRWLSSSQPG